MSSELRVDWDAAVLEVAGHVDMHTAAAIRD
jgi:hypothetical protein